MDSSSGATNACRGNCRGFYIELCPKAWDRYKVLSLEDGMPGRVDDLQLWGWPNLQP